MHLFLLPCRLLFVSFSLFFPFLPCLLLPTVLLWALILYSPASSPSLFLPGHGDWSQDNTNWDVMDCQWAGGGGAVTLKVEAQKDWGAWSLPLQGILTASGSRNSSTPVFSPSEGELMAEDPLGAPPTKNVLCLFLLPEPRLHICSRREPAVIFQEDFC